MFFPISDENPSKNKPLITYILIGLCVFFFVLQYLSQMNIDIFLNYGFIPNNFFNSNFSFESYFPVFSSMFLHGSLAHIAGNMLYLWIFGDNVEDSMGRIRFIIFYLSCGVIAALAQGFVDPSSNIPMVGASGAIAGVLGAYLLLYPRANVKCLFFIIIIIQMVRIPAFIVLGFWIFGQFFSAPFSLESEGGTAYFAHIGGFIAGMILIPFFKKKETKLFNNKANSAWTVFQSKDNMINRDKNFLQDFINKSEKEIKNRK
tara:strand:- start:675 stop:1454 length:780 start_codon:yes stop_codon:yes gene_type:complete